VVDCSGGDGSPTKYWLGFLEAATEPFSAFAQHEKSRSVTPNPVFLQTVPALWLRVLLVAVLRSCPVQVLRVQQSTGPTATVRFNRLNGHVIVVIAILVVPASAIKVRVDTA